MRASRVAVVILLVGLVVAAGIYLVGQSNDMVLRPNDTGVGPRATTSEVQIGYGTDVVSLGIPVDDWVTVWQSGPGGMPVPEVDRIEDGETFWVSETTGSVRFALDLAEHDGVVHIAQLAVENARGGDDDALLVTEVIPAFLDAAGVGADAAGELGLDDPEALFPDTPAEVTFDAPGAVVYLAANQYGLVIGAAGR